MSGWKTYREQTEDGGPGKLTLLVVDDEKRIVESLVELFGDRYRLLTAHSSDQAIDVFFVGVEVLIHSHQVR